MAKAEEAGRGEGGEENGHGGEEEEEEEDTESWLSGEDARHSYRSTTQTSSGRISRPPRKNAPSSPTHHAAAGRATGAASRGKGSAASEAGAAAAAVAASTTTAAAASVGFGAASRTASASSITNGVWGGAGGGLSGLTVKIPPPRDDLFGAVDDSGEYHQHQIHHQIHHAGAGMPISQTPTAVADLYPGVVGVGGAMELHHQQLHHLPQHQHQQHQHQHQHYHHQSRSSTATSSAASSLSPGREHQLLGEPAEAGEGVYDDDAFSKLQALAGRAAPEWAEALNEALGALEGVAANGQPHEELYGSAPQHPQHPHQTMAAAAVVGKRRGGGAGRHSSIGSLTDSQAGSSATGSYLPSDSDAGNSSGSEAAAPVGGAPDGHFLVDEEEDDGLLQPSAKRARLSVGAAAAAATKTAAGAPAPGVVSVVEDEDYGYFTTEEELDQMLLGMLNHGPGVGVGAVGDARSWGLDD